MFALQQQPTSSSISDTPRKSSSSSSKREHAGWAGSSRRRSDQQRPPRSLLVHAVAFGWFSFVWLWHLSPGAAGLPGNAGFGWFFRFLTFYSFTLQTAQLGMATLDDLERARTGRAGRWARPTDDLACAIFALTHVVTLMFYAIQTTTKLAVEGGGAVRPPWLDVSVHAFNTLVAWLDLVTSPRRSFSARSERLSCGLVAAYLGYLMLCRRMNGRFPYPVLNAVPYPWGFVAFVGTGLALFAAAFRVGKLANRRLRHTVLSIRITERVEEEAAAAAGAGAGAATGAAAAVEASGGSSSSSSSVLSDEQQLQGCGGASPLAVEQPAPQPQPQPQRRRRLFLRRAAAVRAQ